MRKIGLLIAIFALLSGCGIKDIDKRFFVVTTGIDWTGNPEKPYRVSLRLAITSSKLESGSSKTEIISTDAASLAEGVRHLKSYVDKELDFGHCRTFIMGKQLLEHGNLNAMSWFARRRDIQRVANFAVGEPDALSILRVQPISERYPGNALFLTFNREGTESPYIVSIPLFDFTRRHFEMGLDPVLPIIRTAESTYIVDRVLLLDKNNMRLALDPAETQLYNMTANRIDKSELVMPARGRDGRIVMTVSQIRTKIRISHAEVPQITMTVKLRGMLEESPPNQLGENWKEIERQLGQQFSDRMEALLEKIRDAGVDPYGFGLHYLATYFGGKEDFKHWQSVYPNVKFKVVAEVKVTGPGVVR
ncbi:Ger(x)C family spore germination protein [Cohnella zeiphila]|uniref:Ger(X)C family spore germination protein n=1 Tax=Cohnella zeiphila TaxID=2761120 RepID=A0A7X0SP74_9BACL|nr:Ger(x)C family spore germination protein [Cohnella zeiphila]MBB6733534.1 Ger(x)C family spore germination protein [Cohnella zeiphila]